ncbi:MAG: adenylosuccinate lyase [bacterium]|jgi:adenylosuccinate lyase
MNSMLALSPLDGRYSSKVEELQQYFSEYALIKYRIKVEIEWLIALSLEDKIENVAPFDDAFQKKLRDIYETLTPKKAEQVKEIEKTTNHDVKAVEYYINSNLEKLGRAELNTMVHFACTSEDINNLSYSLMVNDAVQNVMIPQFEDVLKKLHEKSEAYKKVPMLSRTHGQTASPTTMGKEFRNVYARLERQLGQLKKQEILGKINGAVGNFNAHVISFPEVDWQAFSKGFVESLGLTWNPWTTQIEPHDFLAEVFQNIARWNTIVLDFDRDIWSYISIGAFRQIPVPGQTGSSTMPHKVNPIDFENSEGNLGLANAVLEHLAMKLPISRWQRDLTDSTVLRNIGIAFGYSVLAYKATLKGLSKLAINDDLLLDELSNSWEVIGEAIQTVMRRYSIPSAYEKMKELTRGKAITPEAFAKFIDNLKELPEDVKEELKKLRPDTYLGTAAQF